jgi:thiamine-phosphate pyrophosphorylase
MADSCILYYITDRTAFARDEPTRRLRLLEKISEAATAGINYIQLREKDLSPRDLESLAKEAVRLIHKLATDHCPLTTVLLNSRTDVALAAAAHGVHLPASDISPTDIQKIWKRSARENSPPDPLISVSCHSPQEVAEAAANGADLALFAPVFEKKDTPGATPTGLNALRQACNAQIPVLALGGISLHNAESCLCAGAAGIAAIRLFQENEIAPIVRSLRGL